MTSRPARRTSRSETHVEITGVGFPNGHKVIIDAGDGATVTDGADALRRMRPNCGAVLTIWGGRAQLPADALLRDLQLTHGQQIDLVAKSDAPAAPVLGAEKIRVVVDHGPQAGVAFPVVPGKPLRLALDADGYWSDAGTSDAAVRFDITDTLVSCARETALPGSHALVADRAFTAETFAPGAIIHVEGPARTPGGTTDRAALRIVDSADHDEQRNEYNVIPFRIRPRRTPADLVEPVRLTTPSHPTDEAPKLDIPSVLLQTGTSIAVVLVMSMATRFRIYFLLVPMIQVAISLTLHLRQVEKAKKKHRDVRQTWMKEVEETGRLLTDQVTQETGVLESRNPAVEHLIDDAHTRHGGLWGTSKKDPDFLSIGLGRGTYLSGSTIAMPSQIPLRTRETWVQHFEGLRKVASAPVEFDLGAEHLALVGAQPDVARLATKVLLDLMLSQSPSQLTLVALLPRYGMKQYAWLDGWQHLEHKQSAWLGGRYQIGQREVREAIRENAKAGQETAKHDEHIVIVADDRSGVPISELQKIADSSDGHIHILWLGRSWASVPGGLVTRWAEIDGTTAVLMPGRSQTFSIAEVPGREELLNLSRAMRPMIDELGGGRSVSPIPDQIAIGALVDLDDPEIWKASAIDGLTLNFLVDEIGVWPFDFVTNGPHVLAGGMSGAGKGELIRSALCSAILRYSPRELAILLVDFKGGGSLSPFRNVPHCIGMVSNQSDADVERFLDFLLAEVERREALFEGVNGEYKDFRRVCAEKEALPRLLVVIDEFASFITGHTRREEIIVAVAQKGRALGVHLMMATQSPGSAITAPIRDNVGAKFALKTADAAASEKIIESSDASLIAPSAKGRLFVRLADNNIYQLQSAFTRASVLARRGTDELVTIRPAWSAARESADDSGEQDLHVLIKRVEDLAAETDETAETVEMEARDDDA